MGVRDRASDLGACIATRASGGRRRRRQTDDGGLRVQDMSLVDRSDRLAVPEERAPANRPDREPEARLAG